VAGALETLIEAEEVGRLTLKGFLRPVPAYSLLRLK
jgi:class 3 adenylate cyclase